MERRRRVTGGLLGAAYGPGGGSKCRVSPSEGEGSPLSSQNIRSKDESTCAGSTLSALLTTSRVAPTRSAPPKANALSDVKSRSRRSFRRLTVTSACRNSRNLIGYLPPSSSLEPSLLRAGAPNARSSSRSELQKETLPAVPNVRSVHCGPSAGASDWGSPGGESVVLGRERSEKPGSTAIGGIAARAAESLVTDAPRRFEHPHANRRPSAPQTCHLAAGPPDLLTSDHLTARPPDRPRAPASPAACRSRAGSRSRATRSSGSTVRSS